jgi:hypothetical protein
MTFVRIFFYLKAKCFFLKFWDVFWLNLFFPVFSTKNWKIGQFHHGHRICCRGLQITTPISEKNTVLEPFLICNALVNSYVRSNSGSRLKNAHVFLQNLFFPVILVLKTGKLANFTMDTEFVAEVCRSRHLFHIKLQY